MSMRLIAATVGALTLPGAAAAADFNPPQGCETFLTVQARECSVSNFYRCEGSAPVRLWEALFSGDGIQSIVAYDDKYQWLDARYAWDNSREELLPPAEDPIDIDALIEEGIDTFRFTMRRSAPDDSREITVVGADILTDTTSTIDGRVLEHVRTEMQILRANGTVEYHARGIQYLDRDERLFFLGPEEVYDEAGNATPFDGSPVDFITPGEPGFAQTLPLYECDQQKAGFSPAPVAPAIGGKETDHDQI
ncbi:hypothetical protein GQE99_19195 [Maritimibacter sp. DP07]|jgi:hypothetical protein|uniref:Uncharacterized protein n=1 Tax=Maritimibacter harenae TaxID=2606218 RepID=A0A845M477_9RHOB|nr:hypothetical protein [Maritimibacter harenae]MZR15150.1 hypothetical protein [Maritimibacter harenae]